MSTGKIQHHQLQSKMLQKTPFKTNPRRDFVVYTPPEYQTQENLPCVFFLPGFGSNPQRWLQKDFPMHRLMDYLILAGQLPRALLVCIDGSTALGGSQYVDSVANGPFSQHIVHEIIPYIEHHYGVHGPHHICGHSSGGMGALHLSSLFPKIFRSVASFAGDLHFELTHKNMLADLINDFRNQKLGDSMNECLKAQTTHYVLGLAAAYSPNLMNRRWKVDFPIDLKTAMIQESIWKQWLSFDPLCWQPDRMANLKQLDLVYLSAGSQDQFQLHLGAEAFVHVSQQIGVNSRFEAFDGNHSLGLSQIEAGLKALFDN